MHARNASDENEPEKVENGEGENPAEVIVQRDEQRVRVVALHQRRLIGIGLGHVDQERFRALVTAVLLVVVLVVQVRSVELVVDRLFLIRRPHRRVSLRRLTDIIRGITDVPVGQRQ